MSGSLSLVYEQFAGIDSIGPAALVIAGAEEVIALVVHIIGVVRIAVDQRAGSEEQHSGSNCIAHYAGGPSIFSGFGIGAWQMFCYIHKFFVEVVDNLVVWSSGLF